MAGMLQGLPGGAPMNEPEQAAQPAAEPDDEAPNVTPEEQEAYDGIVNKAFEIIYRGGEVSPAILKLLDDDPSDLMKVFGAENQDLQPFTPAIALAATVAIVMVDVAESYGKDQPDGGIMLHAGKDVLSDLAETSVKAGGREFSDKDVNQAVFLALDFYRALAEPKGLIDEEAAKRDFDQIKQADQDGTIGELIPQLSQAPQPGAQPEGVPQ